MRQWFWRASFNERYRVGGESFVTRDLDLIEKFVVDEAQDASMFGVAPSGKQLLGAAFRFNNSRARAFILALALRRPRNLTNGATIDTSEALSSYNRKQFHHIYPRAHLRRMEEPEEDNTIINICMLAASENNAVSDRDPQEYLPEAINRLGSEAGIVFWANLMPAPSEFDYNSASYGDFLGARSVMVADYIAQLCEGHVH